MLGVIGLLLSLALLMIIVYRGVGVVAASIICGLIVIFTNGVELWPTLRDAFLPGITGFVGNYFFLLSMGALFGQALGDSGSAKAIGDYFVRKMGAGNIVFITTIITSILAYAGVSLFVQVFTVQPLVLGIFREANIPRRFLIGSFVLGTGTYMMTAMPGIPALPNLIPTTYLGTTPTAAPIMGIICSVFMFATGNLFLKFELKKARAKGEGFIVNHESDDKYLAITDDRVLPSIGKAVAPIVVLLVLLLTLSGKFENKNFGVSIFLVIGTIITYILNWNLISDKLKTLNTGLSGSVMALVNTGVLVGFGNIVASTPAYQSFVDFALSISVNPYLSIFFAVNICAGITGSASGGLTIFMENLAEEYLAMGVNPAAFHKIAAIACGGLDSLPHNGALNTQFMLQGTNHKESYWYVFVIMCIIPLLTSLLAVGLALVGIV